MEADWSVEMGHDDPVLEFPWASDDPAVRYHDLKNHPERLSEVPEATNHPALYDFLAAINSRESAFQTAKCDVWPERDSELGGTVCSACYVDVLFADRTLRMSFEAHEKLVKELTRRVEEGADESTTEQSSEWLGSSVLAQHAEIPRCTQDDRCCQAERVEGGHTHGAVEFVVRRCFYHFGDECRESVGGAEPKIGYYVTCYIRGFGRAEDAAYANWCTALRGVCKALLAAGLPSSFR